VAVSHLGHVTRVAHDGGTAVALATEFTPDVIFLDIGLPVMNGYDVARTLRKVPELSNVYMTAVTGWGQDEDRRKAREAGFDGHFTKPLSPAMLDTVLRTVAHRVASGEDRSRTPRTRRRDSEAEY
jgi:CheY-like chemotaxis protein